MTTTATGLPVSATGQWRDADPWVTAGIAFLGEMLVARGLCAANPASNSGEVFAGAGFVLEGGRFATGDFEVRWFRHVGSAGVQNRDCSRAEWTAMLGLIRLAIADIRAA